MKRFLSFDTWLALLALAVVVAVPAWASYERLDNPVRPAVGSQQSIPEVQSITTPANSSTNAVLSATNNPSTSATLTVTAGISNPDVPRNITVTTGGTTADCAVGNVVVSGQDIFGKAISDNVFIKNALNGTGVGTKAFKSVSSIVLPAEQSTHGCTFAVGYGASLGLNRCLDGTFDYLQAGFGGVKEATAPTVYNNASSVSGNMAVTNSTPDGAHTIQHVYLHNYRCLP